VTARGAAPAPHAGTNDTAGPGGSRGASRPRRRRTAALVPYVVAGYPDAETSFAARSPPSTPARTSSSSACRTPIPLADGATLQKRLAGRARERRDARGQPPPDRADRRGAARHPVVPMGYANQFIGGGDGRDRRAGLPTPGAPA
jgi:hypothetical protein